MNTAIATLAIGDKYLRNFNRYCRKLWSAYASKYGFDLIVITEPLDSGQRARSRNPAWQKCLILSCEALRNYERVIWVDSDIIINPASPNICCEVPLDKIGAADAYATPNREDYRANLEQSYRYWSKNNIPYINNLTAADFHNSFGLDCDFESVVQTGVLVMSPKYHKELMEHVYYSYEDKGESFWCYEMRPLSYEIIKSNLEFWLSPKFNMIWPDIKQSVYPFLNSKTNFLSNVLDLININTRSSLITKCATTAYLNNYFLHFAASTNEMKYVDSSITSKFEL